jgi:hypothetical protein
VTIDRFLLLASVIVLCVGCGASGGSTQGGGATTVTFSFSKGSPTVVAARIGSGAFTSQSLNSGKLAHSIPSGTTDFAIAYLCTPTSFPTFERVFEANIADGTSFTLSCVAPGNGVSTGTLTGTVDATAISQANLLEIAASAGNQAVAAGIASDASFSVLVPAGTDRVEVLAYNSTSQGFQTISTLLAARNFDNQAVPGSLNGGNQVVLGATDRTTPQSITYINVPAGYGAPSTFVELIMAGGAGGFEVSRSTAQYPTLPAGAIKTGDSYTFLANVINSAKPTEMMFVSNTSTAPGPVSFSFPAPWSYAGPTPAALPAFDFVYSGFTQSSRVDESAFISWGLPLTTQIDVTATSNYQNGSTTLAIPDLSAVTGFIAPPPSGTQVVWVGLIEQIDKGVQQAGEANAMIASVGNSGFYTVP